MHAVGEEWVDRHEAAAEDNPGQCRACHGMDYRGTVLSRALGNRVVDTEFGTKNFWQGFQIGCYTCHDGPNDDDRNDNRAPVVNDVMASTHRDVPVGMSLSASDADGDSLSLRVVSQPANGTVGLVGTVATYYPFAGFSGSDTFTYAAWDGSTNSNLGTGAVTVVIDERSNGVLRAAAIARISHRVWTAGSGKARSGPQPWRFVVTPP